MSEDTSASPRWGTLTKFLISLVSVVLVGGLLNRFQEMLGPLVLALVLAYLLSPLIERLTLALKMRWGLAVLLTYLTLLLLFITLLVVAGIALTQQIQDLYTTLVNILPDLPARIQDVLSHPFILGPFTIDFSQPIVFGPLRLDFSTLDLQPLYEQVLAAVQPALSQTGTFVSTFASGTATVLGWSAFIFIISFYVLHDLKDVVPSIENVVPEGYAADVRRLAAELGPIWNAFLRGQVSVALSSGIAISVSLSILGVGFAPVLGLVAFLGDFVPFIGPTLSGLIGVLVALFQVSNWWGLSAFNFALIVMVVYIVWQQIQNNVVVPRILGQSLKLHPVVIFVGAIMAANLAGFAGLLLSAPLIATLRLFGQYIYRKMLDLDPWPDPPPASAPPAPAALPTWLTGLLQRLNLPRFFKRP